MGKLDLDGLDEAKQGQHDMILEQYYWMLQLCVMCRRPSEFRMVVKHGISAGLSNRLRKLRMEDFVSTPGGIASPDAPSYPRGEVESLLRPAHPR
jgi:hypothetical protein